MLSKDRPWAEIAGKRLLAIAIALMFLTGAIPLTQSKDINENAILAPKTLDRINEPVIVVGSQVPSYVGYNEADIYVWAYRGGWQQVVFQIDVANGMWEFDNVHKMYGSDDNPGIFDNDDEICFMADETGDQVDASQWAPGADTGVPRIEITAHDPVSGFNGWAYLFHYSTPPSWTTASYVSWNEATNYLAADNYTMDYPNDDTHNAYFSDAHVTPAGGGTGGQFIDRQKLYSEWFYIIFTNRICEQTWVTQWAGDDDDGVTSENSLTVGPVRIIRHWRMAYAPSQSTEWGEKKSFQVFYYRSHLQTLEHGKFWGSTTHRDDRNSIDHVATTPDPQYWDSNGNTATINGASTGDNIVDGSTPLDWYQVSSPYGSYIQTADITFTPARTYTMNWIDNSGANDNDGGRTGASPGKFGDISMHRWDLPSGTTQWNTNYHLYFLPSNAPLQGTNYFGNASNPISTSDIPPVVQILAGEVAPPATVPGSVLIEGLATYSIPKSAAGTIHLTATVDDTGRGDSNIMVANWTNGFANLPGTVMDAVDLAYDEVAEEVEDYIDISSWSAGVYQLYVYGVDANGNQNITSTEHATLTITDDLAPATTPGTVLAGGLAFYSTPLSTASPVDLTATVDDTGRGNSNIASAVRTDGFANFPGAAMAASDGTFDSVAEGVITSLAVQTWDAGVYDLFVYGTDAGAQQNTTSTEHATVQIIDDLAPDVLNVLAEGLPVYTVALADAFFATITATVSDDSAGGSTIAGANLTIGQDNWPSSIPMNPDTALDSDIEAFTYQIDISSWLPGTYYIYVYGWDDVPNYNSAGAFATIIITNDASPEIKNARLDGVVTLNVPFSARGTVTLTGTVDDWGHGDLIIGGANFTLGMANWPSSNPMSPADVLDTPYENFTAAIDISGWAVGTYDFYIYGWDIANDYNVSSVEHATLVIYDDVAPAIENVLVQGLSFYETTLSAAGTVTLTAAVNDIAFGNSVIGGANYTVAEQNWPGVGMTPDTPLNTAFETFSQPIDVSGWAAGIYDIYVYGWDNVPNYNDYAQEFATIVIHDDLAPEILNVLVNGSASHAVGVAQATDIILTATVDDVAHGNTVIGGANYTMGFVNWPTSQPMNAADGAFDTSLEGASVTIDISSWLPGTYDFYVYGWDITPIYNVTSLAYATLIISDDEPPAIYDFLVDGLKAIVTDLDGAGTFTGIVSDEGRGDAIIDAAFFTDGEQNWNATFLMTPDTALDSANESFTEIVDFSGWTAGAHDLYMYGTDILGHANDTSQESVTVTVQDNKAPVTLDWSATVEGAFQVWVDPTVTTTVTLEAEITDAYFGFTNIASANWTAGPANWTLGHSMSALDGGWDNYTENVTAVIDISAWPSGTYEIFVYGTDAAGNGQTSTATYCRIHVDGEAPETLGPWADGQSPYVWLVDDSFQLTAYGDDRMKGNSVVSAAEFFIDWIGPNGTGIPMSPIGFRFDSPYEGAKALVDFSGWSIGEYHTYYVHFKDNLNHWGECGSVLVMRKTEFGINVHTGWNLISIPLVTPTNVPEDILADLDGFWEYAMTSDSGTWLSNSIHRPASTNDFTFADNTIAIWVYLNDADDGFLNVTGALPGPTSINLYAGWNFVGYPTLNGTRTITDALATITYNSVEGYSAVDPYRLQVLPGTYMMQPGEGYWVSVPFDQTWVVDW